MPLAWNEIRQRAIAFSREWAHASKENAEAHTFWDDFFQVFGKSRRAVASFEESVKSLSGSTHRIDVFWPGRLIGEHKSRGQGGQDLAKAHTQAVGYITDLINNGREDEAPRYIITTDFATLAVHDLDPENPTSLYDFSADATVRFPLADLHRHIQRFAFIAGYETRALDPEDPANIEAAELLANLHDRLEDVGYTGEGGHDLQRFMVRVLFCLFADDTGIFEPEQFTRFIRDRTAPDGSDTGSRLAHLFEVLNTPHDGRLANLDEDLAAFPYVNGDLFAERLRTAGFNAPMRTALLECCRFRWETISPAIFGSLFQSIMEDKARRQIGAHYTSERDILKLIRSLFLDALEARLNRCHSPRDYDAFLAHLGSLNILDPACGCGNFLVIAYRELRRLEMDAIEKRFGGEPAEGDIRGSARLNVTQFYGIEIEEWPALIAEVGLWLMDHQMNNELFARFGTATPTIPLTRSPTIAHANALATDWNTILPADNCSYILGNPPFIGSKYQSAQQRAEVRDAWGDIRGVGTLDYVSAWYAKAADYIPADNTTTRAAFVSTNSITQGEQVGVIFPELFRRGIKLDGGHRTFPWTSEARGKAHVHVTIVGFGYGESNDPKLIHDYGPKGQPLGTATVANVSPYLTDGPDKAVTSRSKPLCNVPEASSGNKPIDDGNYLFTPEEKHNFLAVEPGAERYFKRWLGGQEFLQGIERWCLDLSHANPADLRNMPHVLERIENVRRFRLASKSIPTRKLAATPRSFHTSFIPTANYLALPQVSSERRDYIPLAFLSDDVLCGDKLRIIPEATLYHFGVLHSAMHMAWVRQVCGRLESRYQYSVNIVYNNFPWPPDVSESQRAAVEAAAQAVLDARAPAPAPTGREHAGRPLRPPHHAPRPGQSPRHPRPHRRPPLQTPTLPRRTPPLRTPLHPLRIPHRPPHRPHQQEEPPPPPNLIE